MLLSYENLLFTSLYMFFDLYLFFPSVAIGFKEFWGSFDLLARRSFIVFSIDWVVFCTGAGV